VLLRAQRLGFLGPGPVQEHLEQAEAFVQAVSEPRRALDLGSGGGIPGLPLALRWPSSQWVLLDSSDRRTAFLEQAVHDLDMADRVAVITQRAEEAGRAPALRAQFEVVVSRSFGRPAVTAECGGAFVGVGGVLIVSEPPTESPDRWPVDGLAALGLEDQGRTGRVRVLLRTSPVPDGVPRRVGVPAKRPRW
jgi:16S rRNA (guanine527-N7)-methyltransferase